MATSSAANSIQIQTARCGILMDSTCVMRATFIKDHVEKKEKTWNLRAWVRPPLLLVAVAKGWRSGLAFPKDLRGCLLRRCAPLPRQRCGRNRQRLKGGAR